MPINSCFRRRPLKYIGFDGQGHQLRDCLHPRDVAAIVWKQTKSPQRLVGRIQNVSGGVLSAMSLAQLCDWCKHRFGKHEVANDPLPRSFDVPWVVFDSSKAMQQWDWQPTVTVEEILSEIAAHAKLHPDWLEICVAS